MLRRLKDDERGTVAIELVLVVPILVWVLLSTFVYFDLFRAEANNKRAALTIADMLSREKEAIDNDYLDNAEKLLHSLTPWDPNSQFRVTTYTYNDNDEKYTVRWSKNRDIGSDYTNTDLDRLDNNGLLPILANSDRAILLQTRSVYNPAFKTGVMFFSEDDNGLGQVEFNTFTVISSRVGQLCWYRPAPDGNIC